MKNLNWKTAACLLLAIPIVNFVAGQVGKGAGETVSAREAAPAHPAPTNTNIQTVTSSQDAEAITQEKMSIEFLRNFENYTVDRIKVKMSEYLTSVGRQHEQVNLSSAATYVQIGQVKLAVVRISDAVSRQVIVAGVVGKELRRVVCVRKSIEDIPVSYGPCAEKVQQTFGVTFGN